jgi:hypothetical protein
LATLGCNLNPLTEDPGFSNDEAPGAMGAPNIDGTPPGVNNGSSIDPSMQLPGPAATTPAQDEPSLIVDGVGGVEAEAPATPADPGPTPNPIDAPAPSMEVPIVSPGAVAPIADAGAPLGDADAANPTTFRAMDATLGDAGP